MTRLWLRIVIATVAITATLAIALNTFVIGPAADESARSAAMAAATEAQLVAQLVRRGGAPPSDAMVVAQGTQPQTADGIAPLGDGRFVRVSVNQNDALIRGLWWGLLLVVGTGALAGGGWALWVGVVRARDLGRVCRTIRELDGAEAAIAIPARAVSIVHLADAVDGLRATLLQQALSQAELVGIVAHDLRSPLTGICLAGDWLERSHSSTERARARGLIQRECDRLAAIADDVLQICREANSTSERTKRGVAADQLLLDVVDRLRKKGSATQPISLKSAPLMSAYVDSSVARAIGNLAENAARHAPPGTQVSLGVAQTESGAVEFVVEDAGPGFVADVLGRPFVQGANCAGRAGLGLTSVRRVVAAAGGETQFENRPGGGTRVLLRIPQLDRSV